MSSVSTVKTYERAFAVIAFVRAAAKLMEREGLLVGLKSSSERDHCRVGGAVLVPYENGNAVDSGRTTRKNALLAFLACFGALLMPMDPPLASAIVFS